MIFGGFFSRLWALLFGTGMGKIIFFRLMNAENGESIADKITNGMIIELATLPASLLIFEAIGDGKPIGSVQFDHNNMLGYSVDNIAPYTLCQSVRNKFVSCEILLPGSHTIVATPFSKEDTSGARGTSYSISFVISDVIHDFPPPSHMPTRNLPFASPINIVPIALPVSTPVPPILPVPLPIKVPATTPFRLPLVSPSPPVRSCRTPKLDDNGWSNFFPKYPIDIHESQGFMIGNDIVNVGGFINGFAQSTNQTFARDIKDNTTASGVWRRMDDIPIASGITHAAFAVVGKKVYMCGGYLGGHPGPHSPYCFAYDHSKAPGTGQWSKIANIPLNGTAGGGMVYDTTLNTLYYVSGGQRLTPRRADADDVSRTWKYSLTATSNSWVATTPLPYAANHISFVSATDEKGLERHFIFGGQMSENETLANLDSNFEWDTINEKWISRHPMPFGRGHTSSSSVPIGCGFLVAGGAINGNALTGKEATTDISYYSIPMNQWTSIGNVSHLSRTPIVQVGNDGYVYFVYRNSVSRRRGISF